jgi:hypothetical protein
MEEKNKTETHYHIPLRASEYDYLDVVEDTQGRIKISILDTRWRTPGETVSLLREIIAQIS